MSTLPLIQDCVLVALETVGFEVTGGAVLAGNLTDADTSILVDADSIAYVLADQSVTYDVSSGGLVEPVYSDRAAWDALAYSARHANDIDDALGIHHTLGMSAGQASPGNHTHAAPSLALDDLSDVDAPAPGDGEVLAWIDTDNAWEPMAIPTVGQYRQFTYTVSGGDFSFIIDGDGQPVMTLQDLE